MKKNQLDPRRPTFYEVIAESPDYTRDAIPQVLVALKDKQLRRHPLLLAHMERTIPLFSTGKKFVLLDEQRLHSGVDFIMPDAVYFPEEYFVIEHHNEVKIPSGSAPCKMITLVECLTQAPNHFRISTIVKIDNASDQRWLLEASSMEFFFGNEVLEEGEKPTDMKSLIRHGSSDNVMVDNQLKANGEYFGEQGMLAFMALNVAFSNEAPFEATVTKKHKKGDGIGARPYEMYFHFKGNVPSIQTLAA